MKIAIMGAGAFGTALGGILADKGYDIFFFVWYIFSFYV